jgi:hypothetical protein
MEDKRKINQEYNRKKAPEYLSYVYKYKYVYHLDLSEWKFLPESGNNLPVCLKRNIQKY